jgi:hypothetical protein
MLTTVAATPALRAAAATSSPIQPAPTMTTREAEDRVSRSRSLSSTERRYWTPLAPAPGTGSRVGVAPVVSSSLS